MEFTAIAILIVVLMSLPFLAFSFKRALRFLRYFQQEEYDAGRFTAWLRDKKAFDTRGTACFALVGLIYFFGGRQWFALILQAVLLSVLFFREQDPRKIGKIKLNLTARAKRILYLAFGLLIVAEILLLYFCFYGIKHGIYDLLLGHCILLQSNPVILILANFLLSPYETSTKNKYREEAKVILKAMHPFVIGVTGSYGKTSTKNALGEILNTTLAPTFCPPKSINTEMGITRQIRENLKAHQKYAVIEMGAYNVGSIGRLCALTPPQAAIVTVVGMAHLERYGSLERVYLAKSELAQAVPADGILVCCGDDPGARRMATEYPKKTTLLYGVHPEKGSLDCVATNISYSHEGTSFTITWKGQPYSGFTKLLGLPALLNLLGVFTMACTLGADANFVLAALRNIEPVDNRLSFKKEGGISYLNDAYNSNPDGFKAALDVLEKLDANRKILMTPGMIELGNMQFEENKKAAMQAAKICDAIIVVGPTNREAFDEGLKEGGFSGKELIICDTREAAFAKLHSILQEGNLVLIENDLPDLYETVEKF